MKNKGYAIMIDALVAVVFLLIMVTAVFTVELSKTSKTEVMSFKELHYVSEDVLDVLNKNGVLDEIATLWAANSTPGSEEMENASMIAKDYLEKTLPPHVGYRLIIEEGLNSVVVNSSDESRISWNDSSTSTHSTRILVGFGSGLPTFAHISSASLDSLTSKSGSDYAYFGGFVGQGNISRFIDLPSDANITRVYLELNPGEDFKLYINNIQCPGPGPGGIFDGMGLDLSASKWDLTSCKNLFSAGRNWVSINFTSTNEYDFVGGGFLKVDYITGEWDRIPDFTTYWFPGIKGLINVYSGFYVPGNLNDIEVYLHYFHDLPDVNTYFTIADKTIYESDTLGEVNVTLDWLYLSNKFGGPGLLVSALSNKTVPLKWGTDEFAVMASGKGTADAVLITDVSGSMFAYAWSCDVIASSSCDCSQASNGKYCFAPCCRKRINVAMDVDKEFVEQILNTSGTSVGLVSYNDKVRSSHSLSIDKVSLFTQIDGYDDFPDRATCISCGINQATAILKPVTVVSYNFVSEGSVWRYSVDYPIGEPPLDAEGDPWTNITYNDSDWSEGDAILGFESIPYAPNVDTDIGNNLNVLRPNLWDIAADLPQPVDFTSGLNSSGNTFGPDAGDDGWDNETGVYGGTGTNVIFTSNQYLRVDAYGRTGGVGRAASGAYGVQFNITQAMLDTLQGGGTAEFSFRWRADQAGLSGGEWYTIHARFGNSSVMNDFILYGPGNGDNLAWTTWSVDVGNHIQGVGSYYLDFGVYITSCGNNLDHVAVDFDDVDLVITNETGNYFFRKEFNVSNAKKIVKAKLHVLSDDRADVYLNGRLIDSDSTEHNAVYWNRGPIEVNKTYFVTGNNVLAVKLYNNDPIAAKFDLKLNYTNDTKKKAMLVMSDGIANTLLDGTRILVEGCDKPASVEAVNKACEARQYGIDVYSVAFGSGADPCTLKKIACWNCSACVPTANPNNPNCWLSGESYTTCSRFYSSNDADELKKIYGEIANKIANATIELQMIKITFGEVSLENILYPDSYIKYRVGVPPMLKPGETLINLESTRFGNTISTGSFTVPAKTRPIEAKVTSYSGPYWTKSLRINSSSTSGWHEVYNLTDEYGNDYITLGDPYMINIPASDVGVGDNLVEIKTGANSSHDAGGSVDDKVLYSIAMNTYTGVGEPKPSSVGCNWTVEFFDGTNATLMAPYNYNGLKRCNYTSHNISYDKTSSVDDAVYRLFTQLDEDGDHMLDVKFDPNSVIVDTRTIGGIRSLWGPIRVKLELWT
ncbi:MAG: hypothetical protein JW778_06785 [Candidatus Altiarchaeota archaeon]|nr:hypothetical protein [Candidatus Altiarchaeota archaeon]